MIILLNRNLVERSITNKFQNIILTSIVVEAFTNALPFGEDDINKEAKDALNTYSAAIVESLGGFEVLRDATNEYGREVIAMCTEAANKTAKRICKEEMVAKSNKSLDDVVSGACMTTDEYEDLAKNIDTLDMNKVSEIIKEKVIKTIRAEKDAYDRDEDMKQELTNALNDDIDNAEDEKSLESYMDLILSPTDPRNHITFFSKLQDVAYESLMHSATEDTEIPFKALTAITLNSTLNVFNKNSNIDNCLESLASMGTPATECESEVGDKSLVCAVIMYTMLETLKTIGLYSPPVDSVREFVDKPNQKNLNMPAIVDTLMQYLEDIKLKCFKTADNDILKQYYDMLTAFKEKIDTIKSADFDNYRENKYRENVNGTIDSVLTLIRDKINSRISALTSAKPEPSRYQLRDKEYTVSEFNKLNTLYGGNPSIKRIVLKTNPDADNTMIDVECSNYSGSVVDTGYINIKYSPIFGTFEEFIRQTYKESKLASAPNKQVELYYTNGSAKTVIL